MHQRTKLFADLSIEDISASLDACTLPQKDEYTEDEVYRFKECRSLIAEGKTYKQAAAHFRRQDKSKQQTSEAETKTQLLDISELLALASEQVETRISLTEAVQILDSCGLPDQEQYTSLEGDRFLEACELVKKENKSYEEVATHFGKPNQELDLKADMQEILSMVGSAAIATDNDLLGVLKQLAAKRGHVISGMYERMLLTQVAQHLKDRQQKRQLFTEFGERLEAYVEGKSSIPSWGTLPAFSDQPTLKSLPQSSTNL